ncbi:MAG: sodium-translocating pyrophosphatase [Candidatus Baldrarchaeia archaeon]
MLMFIVGLILATAIAGVVGAIGFFYLVNKYGTGTEEMRSVWVGIRQGSSAYLNRQFKTIMGIALIIAIFIALLGIALPIQTEHGPDYYYGAKIAGSFILGSLFSITAAYISMDASTRANVRTTAAAVESTRKALTVATYGGAVLGLMVISMSLLGLTILYIIFRDPAILAGFGFGASLAALFAQLGGGIYTKAADIGADLVGKVEVGIPEDDPRNPAVIADQVGDNVGDCAGRGADLFESVTAENLGGMIIGVILYFITGIELFIILPLLVRAIGILATFIGVAVSVKYERFSDPMTPLRVGFFVSAAACAIILGLVLMFLIPEAAPLYLYVAALTGIIASIFIVLETEIYTASESTYVKRTAESAQTGAAINILSGLASGMESTALPIITIAAALVISFWLGMEWAQVLGFDKFIGGVYGTTMATMGMLSVCGMVLTMDGVGPIVDNAGGIAELSGAEKELRDRLDPLDALGNTTKALTKGYAMASAALAALLLFQAFILEVARYEAGIWELTKLDPETLNLLLNKIHGFTDMLALNKIVVVIGAFIGAMIPFLFSATAIRAVGDAAHVMVEEVRRQFREIPGLLEGKAKPDYSRCVDISTKYALKRMVVPGAVAIVSPILVGWLFGWVAVGALVVGATITGVPLAITMMWGGCIWDNAKKYVEAGHFGGKGSPTHAAAVVGDTVGDPLKDTAGPSLHILIKLLNTVSLVFIPLFLAAVLAGVFVI